MDSLYFFVFCDALAGAVFTHIPQGISLAHKQWHDCAVRILCDRNVRFVIFKLILQIDG